MRGRSGTRRKPPDEHAIRPPCDFQERGAPSCVVRQNTWGYWGAWGGRHSMWPNMGASRVTPCVVNVFLHLLCDFVSCLVCHGSYCAVKPLGRYGRFRITSFAWTADPSNHKQLLKLCDLESGRPERRFTSFWPMPFSTLQAYACNLGSL